MAKMINPRKGSYLTDEIISLDRNHSISLVFAITGTVNPTETALQVLVLTSFIIKCIQFEQTKH